MSYEKTEALKQRHLESQNPIEEEDEFQSIKPQKMHEFDNDDQYENKKQIAPSTKKKIQLTF
jgi:hypothetical protein